MQQILEVVCVIAKKTFFFHTYSEFLLLLLSNCETLERSVFLSSIRTKKIEFLVVSSLLLTILPYVVKGQYIKLQIVKVSHTRRKSALCAHASSYSWAKIKLCSRILTVLKVLHSTQRSCFLRVRSETASKCSNDFNFSGK